MRVWIDQDLCTGDGLCTDHCPEVFVLLEDGLSYVHQGDLLGNDPGGYASAIHVPARLVDRVVLAATDCPGECIVLEPDAAAPPTELEPDDEVVDAELVI